MTVALPTTPDIPASPDLAAVLEWVARGIRRRSMLLVVTDDLAIDDRITRLLRRLRAQHEVVWLTIGDADLMTRAGRAGEVFDIVVTHRHLDHTEGAARLAALVQHHHRPSGGQDD